MFEDIKVGDRVVYHSRWHKDIVEVSKVTPKRFETMGYSFTKKDGYAIGSSSVCVEKLTPELESEILEAKKRSTLINALSKFDYKQLDTETLEQIAELTKPKDV